MVVYLQNMVILHSYVSLPEANIHQYSPLLTTMKTMINYYENQIVDFDLPTKNGDSP